MIKVKDNKGLVRDPYSKAIINVDNNALLEHRRKKQFVVQQTENSKRIDKIETEIIEIKNLLKNLVDKLTIQ